MAEDIQLDGTQRAADAVSDADVDITVQNSQLSLTTPLTVAYQVSYLQSS
jgi:hypothetical protein